MKKKFSLDDFDFLGPEAKTAESQIVETQEKDSDGNRGGEVAEKPDGPSKNITTGPKSPDDIFGNVKKASRSWKPVQIRMEFYEKADKIARQLSDKHGKVKVGTIINRILEDFFDKHETE